jgi:uncharacterized protein YggE
VFKQIALIAVLAAASWQASASDLPGAPFVHANGVGSVRIKPDIGDIAFEIKAYEVDPAVARQVVETRIAEIRSLAAGLGVPPAALLVRDVRKEIRKVEDATPGEPLYELRCWVHIKLDNLAKWTALLSPLLNMPNVDGFVTEFNVRDREKIEMKLLGDAVRMARGKAKGLAAGQGKKLGAVRAVSPGPLSNLTRSMGLAPAEQLTYNTPPRVRADSRKLLVIGELRIVQTVDVIFSIGK